MNFKQLEAFQHFMDKGSVTLAAKSLGVSQPAVSRLLGDLEKSVGFAMFHRKRNHLNPTAEAIQFHKLVARSFIGIAELQSQASAIANAQMGSISVAAQPVYMDTFLLDAVAAFHKVHPGVTVRLHDVGHEVMLEQVSSHQCDFGLGITLNLDRHDLEIEPIMDCRAVCVLPITHPLATQPSIHLDDLKGQPFIDLHIGSPLRTRVDHLFQQAGRYRQIRAEARTMRAVCRLVSSGSGIAISDPFANLLINPETTVIRPFFPAIEWDVAIFQPANTRLSNVEQSFRAIMRSEVLRILATL